MKSQVGVSELAERIRAEALRQRGGLAPDGLRVGGSSGDEESLQPPSLPPPPPGAAFLEGFLAEAGSLIARARLKLAVRPGVPKLLRPFYRNQGGYNGVVLETLESLREVSRGLTAENELLRAHMARQEEWMRGVAETLRGLQARVDVLAERDDA